MNKFARATGLRAFGLAGSGTYTQYGRWATKPEALPLQETTPLAIARPDALSEMVFCEWC